MSDSPSYLRALSSDVPEALDTAEERERRARISAQIQALAIELHENPAPAPAERPFRRISPPRRGTAWALGGLTAAAAAVAFALVGPPDLFGSPSSQPSHGLARNAETHSVAQVPGKVGPKSRSPDGQTADATRLDERRLPEPSSELTLSSGARVTTEPGTRFALMSPSEPGYEELRLSSGSVRLEVPKLGTKQRLVVTTEEATVEVRGTVFEVARRQVDSRRVTHVSVTEGLVSVKSKGRESLLGPGESWSTQDDGTQASSTGESTHRANAPRFSQRGQGRTESTKVSDLAEQNRLYQAALAAKKSGQAARSEVLLRSLLRRYPGSPLEVAAKRELERLAEDTR